MDNDNKVDKKMHQHNEVLLFLKDELQPLSHDKPHSYDLETEYAKTRKNKTTSIWILMIAAVIVVGLFAFGISKYVDYTNNNIKININAFDDLNLRSLLDVVGQSKDKYDTAVKEKSELEAELAYGTKQAEQKKEADLFTLQSLKLNPKETNKRAAVIRKEYDDTITALHAQYDVQIDAKQNLINHYKEKLDEYDSNKVTQAKEQEAAVDSQRQLNEFEKKQLIMKYENEIDKLRGQMNSSQQDSFDRQKQAVKVITNEYQARIDALDPTIADDKGIISRATAQKQNETYQGTTFMYQLNPYASEDYRQAITDTGKILDDFKSAASVVQSVPQKKSIPLYVKAMVQFAYSAVNNITSSSSAEINRLVQLNNNYLQKVSDTEAAKNKTIQKLTDEKKEIQNQSDFYQTYFESTCGQSGAQGMIITLSTTTKIPVYIVQSCRTYFTDQAYEGVAIRGAIVRKNASVAKVTISYDNGLYYCVPDDVSAGSKIRIGDFITIDAPTAVK